MKQYETRLIQLERPGEPGIKDLFRRLIVVVGSIFYRLFTFLFHPPVEEKEYKVSLCTVYKNEAPYLREWIEFHLLIGVSHFFLYDNMSTDCHEEILQPYIDRGIVTLTHWPHNHAQVKAFEDCIERYSNSSEWIGFVDVDEFVMPLQENYLPDVLKAYRNKPAVLINWKIFNSSGFLSRDRSNLVTEDFVCASRKLMNRGKCFYNTAWEYLKGDPKNSSMFHQLWTRRFGLHVPPCDLFGDTPSRYLRGKYIPVQINHYTIKSKEEYMEKNTKGDVYYDRPVHSEESFYFREYRCSSVDLSAYKYLSALKERLGLRSSDPIQPTGK